MSPITVYTKPACMQCTATFKALDKSGVDYREIDVTQNADAREYVMSLGYLFSLVFANCLNGRAEPWPLQVPAVRRAVRSPPAPGDEPHRTTQFGVFGRVRTVGEFDGHAVYLWVVAFVLT